jgi:hypothetical protein
LANERRDGSAWNYDRTGTLMKRRMGWPVRAAATGLLVFTAACGQTEEPRGVAALAALGQPETHPAFLYGQVTTTNGERYRGRLRFGAAEEAFWADYFNGVKAGNPWVEHLPKREWPTPRASIFGLAIGPRRTAALRRPFMSRFGDIAKLEADGRDLWVTMRSGTVHHLDRYAADDFADGLRVWDDAGRVVDLTERRIRTIEFMAPARATSEAPYRLHGTVYARQGEFTGFIQWGREGNVALDELEGKTADGERIRLPFATIRAIARQSRLSSRVTLLDGRELVLSGTRHVGEQSRGLYVDDARYGRVLVSWDALYRADFTPPGTGGVHGGPSYHDFTPGSPLSGTVVTRSGARYSGRLVFDLDESEDTETLDAPARGVHYTLPFSLVQSVVLPGGGAHTAGPAHVFLRTGEQLRLERAGDLAPANGGMLIFTDDREPPEYVPWRDVAGIDFDAISAVGPAVRRTPRP